MSRTVKLYNRLDSLEAELLSRLIKEFRQVAGGTLLPDELHHFYIYRRPFPDAVLQEHSDNSTWMLKAEREILALRRKLKDEVPGPVVGLVDEYERILKADLKEHHHEHGTSWSFAARRMLERAETLG